MAYNDLSIKIGHFYTIMGYEVVQAPGNFFYSHAYGMNFGQPFTHTGLLAEYDYDCNTTLYGGYVMGWDTGFDNHSDSNTFLGGINRQINDNVNVTYTVNAGRFGNGIGPSGNAGSIFSHSLVLDVQLTDRVNYVLMHDLAINNGGIPDGIRISTVNDGLNDPHFFEATVGLNWTPCANLIVRPEFRFDWVTSHSDGDFNDVYLNNTKSHLETFGVDFIYLF